MVGTPGHDAAGRFIIERLRQIGIAGYEGDSYELPYRRGGESFLNILGRLAGANPELPPVLVAAHYDTCGPYPGAGDNAAAVAILLTVAERLKRDLPERGVLIAFFDAEEPPHFLQPSMGSIRFYEDQRQEEVHCAIVMDLVGHDVPVPKLEHLLFITGMESDPGFDSLIRSTDPGSGIGSIPTLNRYIGDMSDHHIFRTNQRPYMLLTCGRWEDYHTPWDTPEKLNYSKMGAIADYVYNLTIGASELNLDGPFESYSTTETELYFLNKELATVLSNLGMSKSFESREDIDVLVNMMLSGFQL